MSRTIAKARLIGNLGNDAEVRYLPNSGTPVATFNLANNITFKTDAGEQQQTEWHRIRLIGALAEALREHLKKGAKVFVEGDLRVNKWQDNNGIDRTSHEVVIAPRNGGQLLLL